MVDNDSAETRLRKFFKMLEDERLAVDFKQGFGYAIGERPHAFAAAGGEYHRNGSRSLLHPA
jgi:hypothetical protein